MAEMNCTDGDQYISKDGKCCDRCAAGYHMKTECYGEKKTECVECERGFYTATKNHLNRCQLCKVCSSSNKQKTVKQCTGHEDTVCECDSGFYCSDEHCDHCRPVTHCNLGEGVKVKATRSNDTICAPCQEGTFSNITDFHSPCQAHTRCEDIGRQLKTAGTPTSDAFCGGFKSHCNWILPAGLWSGLLLTALLLFVLICWREKRKSYRAASSRAPVTLTELIPAKPDSPLQNGHCPESCTVDCCDLPIYNPDDDNMISDCTKDSVDSYLPITPLKASVSFADSNHTDGGPGNFFRTYSEPQEDEWCGT